MNVRQAHPAIASFHPLSASPMHTRPYARLLPALVALFAGPVLHAQTPTKCLEIESILVDACTSQGQCTNITEGQNEMVRFITGPAPIAISDLSVHWPNNSFLGLVQNSTTASIVDQLNATILSCGHLLEPPAGIIPAGKRVLMITSTDMCVPANSFAALSDTLYVIFQNPGNTSGHFANQNNGTTVSSTPTGGSSTRMLTITYVPTNCTDTAIYDRSLLVNIYGTYGGSPAENDGATARFAWPGEPVASYVNLGCQAPIIPLTVDITTPGGTVGCGGSTDLAAVATGGYVSLQWSGGTGTFGSPNTTTTTYTAGSGDNGAVTLYCCVTDACDGTVCDSVVLTINGTPTAQITPSGGTALCDGATLTLTASGGATYTWSTGETTPAIDVNSPGTYTVTASNDCGTDNATITITAAQPPQVTIIGNTSLCPGSTTTLTASGGTSYAWSTGATSPSIQVNTGGDYEVTVSNGCTSAQGSVTVQALTPEVEITALPSSGPAPLTVSFQCDATPAAVSWSWDLGNSDASSAPAPTELYDTPGTYPVTVTITDVNGCTVSAGVTVDVIDLVPSSVVVPNVFSPNGDGRNDYFRIVSTGLATLHVQILNRWGQEAGVIDDPNGVWNGRMANNEVASDGTYFYYLRATGHDGRSYDLHGALTLLH